ncbi:GCN5-related N-acetyltransferase [Kangiella koreensis DSM 16069]|uniref:GCN5-related N-acetyltransferase n=1 Tax=Kangiella koreensis (strain DSM 16069 / JCM 12317 / KCTC 12182 / SW-125) TaxID=523791 RepID=C7R683_KANKD|nr:GCN5-related N-acetyltransferase [Kangiella koreensis DSM 16069]
MCWDIYALLTYQPELKLMTKYTITNANLDEFKSIGDLMVRVYSALEGFPKPEEQPTYYQMLRNVGSLTETPSTELFVAKDEQKEILGAVVFFGDMKDYGSGGTAVQEKGACGFRLLAVAPAARGLGIGKALSIACIERTKLLGKKTVVIHSTEAMKVAWGMYERLGFKRELDLDFTQQDLPVYGFRLKLN